MYWKNTIKVALIAKSKKNKDKKSKLKLSMKKTLSLSDFMDDYTKCLRNN